MGIVGNLLNWLENYISERYQKVVLNGVISNVCFLESRVLQRSILEPLLFLIYINDIIDDMECHISFC